MSYADKLEELQRLRAEVRRLERQAETEAKRMSPITEADERTMLSMQSRADEAYTAAGRRAPPPLGHERPDEYRRRLADGVKSYSDRWREANLNVVADDTALSVIEEQIYADAASHGRTAGLRAREIKPIQSRTAAGTPRSNLWAAPNRHSSELSSGRSGECCSESRKSTPR